MGPHALDHTFFYPFHFRYYSSLKAKIYIFDSFQAFKPMLCELHNTHVKLVTSQHTANWLFFMNEKSCKKKTLMTDGGCKQEWMKWQTNEFAVKQQKLRLHMMWSSMNMISNRGVKCQDILLKINLCHVKKNHMCASNSKTKFPIVSCYTWSVKKLNCYIYERDHDCKAIKVCKKQKLLLVTFISWQFKLN